MGVFESVTLTWQGKDYQVPPNRLLRLIAAVEDKITLSQIVEMAARGQMKFALVAEAYAAALRVAGVKPVGPDDLFGLEVHAALFEGKEAITRWTETVDKLVRLMTPPQAMQNAPAKGAAQMGNGVPVATKGSSRKPSKRPSGSGASAQKTSGG